MRHSQGKYLKTHDYIAPARAIIRTPLYAPIQWPWRAHTVNRAVARAPVRSRACPGTPAAAAPVHVQGPSELLRPCMFRVGRNCCACACSGAAGTAAPVHVQGRPELLRLCMSRVGRSCCACACSGAAGTAASVHVQGWPELLRLCMSRVGRNCCVCACSGLDGDAAPVHVQGRAQLAVPVRRGPVVPPNDRDKYAVQSDHGPMRL